MRALLPPALLAAFSVFVQAAEVRTERVPENGVQPQIVRDNEGTLHLVYLTGPAGGSEVRHATKKTDARDWSSPLTVNSLRASAVAAGTIRGAQAAIGKNSSIHVVWNGPGGKGSPSPLYYTRSTNGGRTFEPQRDLRGAARGLDGGATIAASPRGEVFVLWHGVQEDTPPGEVNRSVFMLKSTDNGSSFAPASIVNVDDPGVCACCSMKSFIAPDGKLLTLYRAARQIDQRDITLLSSPDGGTTFKHEIIGRWPVKICPMSSMTMVASQGQTRAAWETDGTIFTSVFGSTEGPAAVSPKKCRHPALAANSKGEVLVCWSAGTGWQKGGELGWTVLNASGKPAGKQGSAPGVPVWGMSAAYVVNDNFVVMY